MSDRQFEEIVPDLAKAYVTWKEGEKDKNTFKEEFFSAITKHFTEDVEPAVKLVEERAKTQEEAEGKAAKRYPTWNVYASQPHEEKDGIFEVGLMENSEYLPFSFEHDGKVYKRQISAGSIYVDDKRLEDEDPDLYEEIMELPPWLELVVGLIPAGESERAREFYRDHLQMKDLEDLSPGQLASLQEYIYEGKPTVKFPAPSKAAK